MSIDKELFTKCLTQGVPVYGAHSGRENEFVQFLSDYLEDSGDKEYVCYIDPIAGPNTLFFEIKMDEPSMGIKVENEYLIFFQIGETEGMLGGLEKEDVALLGDFTMRVISFVSAWNKKVLGQENKSEYDSMTRVDKNYDVQDLYEKYINKMRKEGKVDYYQ
jgi:hypothetical protein